MPTPVACRACCTRYALRVCVHLSDAFADFVMTTSVVYHSKGENLAVSMLNGVVAPGSVSRTFKKGVRIAVLDKISKDEAWVAIAESEGGVAKSSYDKFWPNWSPGAPSKVTVSKVRFITARHRIKKEKYGKLSQTNIAKANIDQVISYVLEREAEK